MIDQSTNLIIHIGEKSHLLGIIFTDELDLEAWNRQVRTPLIEYLAIYYFHTTDPLTIKLSDKKADNIICVPKLYSELHLIYRITYLSQCDIYTTRFFNFDPNSDVQQVIKSVYPEIKEICHIGQCFYQFVSEPITYIANL